MTISPTVIAITGAQGVGKSTLCRKLHSILGDRYREHRVSLVDGLGARVRAAGFVVGKAADAQTVAAIFSEHLSRERQIASDIAILDRCAIDALAYVRMLGVSTSVEAEMYAEVARLMSRRLNLVVHLQLSETFLNNCAAHEDPDFRSRISREVPTIIQEFGLKAYSIDASACESLEGILEAISAELR